MKNNTILIRCDSSALMGSGHVMRCLSLAEKLRNKGHLVEFASRNLAYNINNVIEKKQFKLHSMKSPNKPHPASSDESDWLEVSLQEELTEFHLLLDQVQPEWVIVDHYALGRTWEDSIKLKVKNLFVIDDLFREHHCSYLLDQNFHTDHFEKWKSKVPQDCHLFLGPKFALLSDSLVSINQQWRAGEVTKLLAFFGGSDAAQASEKFVQAWKLLSYPHIKVTLVIGSANPRRDELLKINLSNFDVKTSSEDFHKWLSETDLYVGAAGSTTLERIYFGIPGVSISIANNQIEIAKNLAEANIHDFAGNSVDLTPESLAKKMQFLIQDQDRRSCYSRKSLELQVGSEFQSLLSIFN